jgi:ribosome-associated toxin RatA of RatAB toxin-antitoxin module
LKNFQLRSTSILTQKQIFNVSTDVENFHLILPNYFKSLKIIDDKNSEKIVIETIRFLGISLNVKTKHVIMPPETHKIYILSGPLRESSFIEYYRSSQNGTDIIIDVHLKFNRFLNFFSFLHPCIVNRMDLVMREFIHAAEQKFTS